MKSLIAKSLVAAFLAAVSWQNARAEVISAASYAFPIADPYLATITSAANHPVGQFKVLKIAGRPDRGDIPLWEGKNEIPLAMYLQPKKSAPVVFVIAGAGGNAFDGSALMLAEELKDLGYHAITLPDPLSWQYVLSVSESGAPGFLPRDTSEYYGFMRNVAKSLSDQGIIAESYSVVGYSMGGLLTGFLAKEDRDQGSFHFRRVLVINPALDIGNDIDVLDGLFQAGHSLNRIQKYFAGGAIFKLAPALAREELNSVNLLVAVNSLNMTTAESQWIIGKGFRVNLASAILASQQVHDLGILADPATPSRAHARLADAESLSFRDYMDQIVIPSLNLDGSQISEALRAGSFYVLGDFLKTAPNVFLMENADDLLLKPGDLEFLKETFGDRLELYPLGGHVGNLWFDKNREDLSKIMR